MTGLYTAGQTMGQLEKLAMKNSFVHRLNPLVKIIITLLYIITIISFPVGDISKMAVFFFYPFVMTAVSEIPIKPLFSRLIIAMPFSFFGAIANLFILKSTVYTIFNFAVTLGMVSFVSIMIKTFLTVFAALILIATTKFTDIVRQLNIMKMPKILSLQLAMTYRYISVLLNEALTMVLAYNMRAPKQKGIKMKHMGSFIGQLLLRSFDFAGAVYEAMKMRGFSGVYPGGHKKKLNKNDILFLVIVGALIICFRIFKLF